MDLPGPLVDDGRGLVSPVGVVVFGMHRSGTSALTRVLVELGLSPGPLDRLNGASEANPYGHFEPAPLQQLNERVLNRLDRYWHCPPTNPAVFGAVEHDAVRFEVEELMGSLFPRKGWVYKDPRLCVMWPLYRPLFLHQPAAVFIARHPAEVAVSLHTRDTIPIDYALDLWEFHNRIALRELADFGHVHVVRHDELLADPGLASEDLAEFCDDAGIPRSPGERSADQLVDSGLRRSAAAAADVVLGDDTVALWEQIGAMAELGYSPAVAPPSDRLLATVDGRAARVRAHIEALRQGWEQPVESPHRPAS
ncbi:MAG: hypothetical protein KDB21_13570 [Acidimicrobiales bacterium]|nr:hypothetical protein [Acidimicrobiales bacterium]